MTEQSPLPGPGPSGNGPGPSSSPIRFILQPALSAHEHGQTEVWLRVRVEGTRGDALDWLARTLGPAEFDGCSYAGWVPAQGAPGPQDTPGGAGSGVSRTGAARILAAGRRLIER